MRDCLFELVPMFSHSQLALIIDALTDYFNSSSISSDEYLSLMSSLGDCYGPEDDSVEFHLAYVFSKAELIVIAKALQHYSGDWLAHALASQIMQFLTADRVVLHSDFVSSDRDLFVKNSHDDEIPY